MFMILQKTHSPGIGRTAILIYLGALLVQFFHWIEHIVQVYQHWWIGLSIKESQGILFFLDLEWNHLIFNALYFILLIIVWQKTRHLASFGKDNVAKYALGGGLLLQGYHVIEHMIRIVQYFQTGCTPCKGLLGWYIDGVYLHFIFNTFVLVLPLIAFCFFVFRSNRGAQEKQIAPKSL